MGMRRGGRAFRTYRRGLPAASSLSHIFEGHWERWMAERLPRRFDAGSLDCVAGNRDPLRFRRRHTYSWPPQAVDGLRNSSTTVVRRMLASMKIYSDRIIAHGPV